MSANNPIPAAPLVEQFATECDELVRVCLRRGHACLTDRSSFWDLSPDEEQMLHLRDLVGRWVDLSEGIGAVARELHKQRNSA